MTKASPPQCFHGQCLEAPGFELAATHQIQSGRNRRCRLDTQLLAHHRLNEGFKRWAGDWQGQRALSLNQLVHVRICLYKQGKKCGVNAFVHACKLDIFAP